MRSKEETTLRWRRILVAVVALIVMVCILLVRGTRTKPLEFTTGGEPVAALTWIQYDDTYLSELRSEFGIDDVVSECKTDFDKVKAITTWVTSLWKHDGRNTPSAPDPLTILREASEGQRFRCVEYGIVMAASLQSLGIPARMLALKTEDVETRESGAGHVCTEVYLWDIEKWVFIDPQWGAIPVLDDVPLNAVEFQQALAANDGKLVIWGVAQPQRLVYERWIGQYLYYFDYSIGGGRQLMLGPVGAPEPKVFQRTMRLGDIVYTHSVDVFYAPPVRRPD